MISILKKLQFKEQEKSLILNSPTELKSLISELLKHTGVDEYIRLKSNYDFVIVFVKSCAEIKSEIFKILNHLEIDATLWFAYPKKSSKKYSSDISRDDGWQPLGKAGFEAVRQVAIDEDWSALRFRKAEFIKSFKRDKSRAMGESGKRRES